MNPIRLSDRTVGFFAFEREFLKESNHRGFVKFTGDGTFQLVSNQFMKPREGHFEYRLPEDIVLHDNQLVELSVGPRLCKVDEFAKRSTLAASYRYYYEVLDAQPLQYRPPRPYISRDEFLYRLTRNWNRAHEDQLDECIALQVLSCPPNTVPIGGIGSQTLHYGTTKSPLAHLSKTIAMSLPGECFGHNSTFRFGIVENLTQNAHLRRIFELRTIPEISYNYMTIIKLSGKPLPIAVPTLVENATFNGERQEPDRDVLEYVLLSHFREPVVSDQMVDKFIRCIKEIREDQAPAFLRLGIDIDKFSINRVAQAFCRLDFKDAVDDDVVARSRRWLKSVFARYYEAIEDTFDTKGDAYREPSPKPISVYEDLPKREKLVLKKIVELFDETGQEVSTNTAAQALTGQLDETSVVASIDKLYLEGFVVRGTSGKGYKPLIMDD